MPVYKCESNGKWRVGSGECKYDTKEKAEEVWRAILASGQYGKLITNDKDIELYENNLRKKEGGKGEEVKE